MVTGINGFIASWVIKYLLEQNTYKIRGTIRDPNNKSKVEILREVFGKKLDEIELVKGDLNDRESLDKAVKDCDYVIHIASPIPIKTPKNEDEIIVPAVNGVKFVLEACLKYKIKRVVLTSSFVACMNYDSPKELVNEECWGNENVKVSAYIKSKILAEKKAWEINNNGEIDLVVLNPGIVLGPPLITKDFFSGDIVASILTGKYGAVPPFYSCFVDVREVAQAHLKSLTTEHINTRFILGEYSGLMTILGTTLKKEWKKYGYPCTERTFWPSIVKFIGYLTCNDEIKENSFIFGKKKIVDSSKSKEKLGVNYRPLEDSLNEMVKVMIESGIVKDLTKGKK